jgi:hypothetical protein
LRAALYMPAVGIIRRPAFFETPMTGTSNATRTSVKHSWPYSVSYFCSSLPCIESNRCTIPISTVKGVGEHDGSPTVARLAS